MDYTLLHAMGTILKILLVLAGIAAVVLVIGLVLPKERVVSRTGHFAVTPEVLYGIVTDNTDWQYRTSLKDLILIDDKAGEEIWEEYSAGGAVIRFKTREKRPYSYYSFDLDAGKFTGCWTGTFEPDGEGGTVFTATEHIRVKNPFIRTLSYMFFNIGKYMDIYQSELRAKTDRIPPVETGIIMRLSSPDYRLETEQIRLTVENRTQEDIFTGEYYDIYRSVDGLWEKIPLELAFIDIAYILQPGGSRDFTIGLYHELYDYSAGKYRVGKNVNGREIFAEFALIP